MLDLKKHREKIDPELHSKSSVLPISAIKTDATDNSLKLEVGLNCIKTCDYIRFNGHKTLTLIECSDLTKQKTNLEIDLNTLIDKSIEQNDKELTKLAKKVKKNHRCLVDKIIYDELIAKYKDTLLLVNKITNLTKTEANFSNRFSTKNFIIITNKHQADKPADSIALDAFKRKLESDLKSGLGCIINNATLMLPDTFLRKFKNL